MSRNPISDEQIEIIKATFAETGSITASANAAKCALSTAKKYADNRDQYEAIRSEKRVDIIAKIAEVQVVLLNAMTSEDRLKRSTMNEIGVTFGIISDKRQLLTGQATTRTETITDPSARLTPEEMELAAKIREKHAVEVSV